MAAEAPENDAAQALWRDWVTIWQSEWAAIAADREVQEAVQRTVDAWAAGLKPTAGPAAASDPPGSSGPAAPPRPPPADAPPLGLDPAFAGWLARPA